MRFNRQGTWLRKKDNVFLLRWGRKGRHTKLYPSWKQTPTCKLGSCSCGCVLPPSYARGGAQGKPRNGGSLCISAQKLARCTCTQLTWSSYCTYSRRDYYVSQATDSGSSVLFFYAILQVATTWCPKKVADDFGRLVSLTTLGHSACLGSFGPMWAILDHFSQKSGPQHCP